MFGALRQRVQVGGKATSRVADLAVRQDAKLVGLAQPGTALLTAPITGRSCVFYSVTIGEWFNGTKTPLLRETSSAAFRLADTSAAIFVAPLGSEVEVYLRDSRKRGHSSECLDEHRALLARQGFGMLDDYGERRSLAYEEVIVAPNDKICVLGAAEAISESGPSGRDVHGQRFRMRRIVAL